MGFVCTLDGIAEECGLSSFTPATRLANGTHTFTVAGGDSFDNFDPTPASASFTVFVAPIDDVAPQTTIDSGPKSRSAKRKASLLFHADEGGASFECRLDNAAFAPCVPPQKYDSIRRGRHRFHVRATDPAGNTDPTPAAFSWRVHKRRHRG